MLRVILFLLVGYALLVGVVWLMQGRLLYLPGMPGRRLTATPADIGLEYETVWLTAADGVKLHAWFTPAKHARATLLFFHGNAGNISHRLDSIRIFHDLGLAVLIQDYRGYGQSLGRPSEQGTALDARAAWRHLTEERGIPAARIVVFGRSLGAAVAAELAREVKPGAVILESAFRSVPDIAADAYPFLPARRLSRFRYATEAYVKELLAPLLVIHSRDDEIIPFHHGEAVFRAAREPKSFLELQGGHNTGFLESQAVYSNGIGGFLEQTARLPQPDHPHQPSGT